MYERSQLARVHLGEACLAFRVCTSVCSAMSWVWFLPLGLWCLKSPGRSLFSDFIYPSSFPFSTKFEDKDNNAQSCSDAGAACYYVPSVRVCSLTACSSLGRQWGGLEHFLAHPQHQTRTAALNWLTHCPVTVAHHSRRLCRV